MLGAGTLALVLALAASGSVPRWPAWLCLPGASHDWCVARLTTTTITESGSHTTANLQLPASQPIDCFYVYPTVSLESRANSDLTIQTSEEDVAVDEASPFSQDCRVFAPMYNQVTAYGGDGYYGRPNYTLEYTDVLAAWRDYLAHYNHGRGVVLLGHSEGSFLLKRLIAQQIEPSSSERRLLVSAILLGGDVAVADQGEGGDMPTTPACSSRTQIGCVVAYSSFPGPPPAGSGFESLGDPKTQHILCVNPVDPGSKAALPITPWFPSFDSAGVAPLFYGGKYFWIEFPDMYTAQCVRSGNRAWLQIRRTTGKADRRPGIQEEMGADAGYHEADFTLALPQLVTLVAEESTAYLHLRH
jgi:hypothetical protein